jgi:hypothetical protein
VSLPLVAQPPADFGNAFGVRLKKNAALVGRVPSPGVPAEPAVPFGVRSDPVPPKNPIMFPGNMTDGRVGLIVAA